MSNTKKNIKENPREPVKKSPTRNESRKRTPKALMGDCKAVCSPHYYGIYTNAAQINGARKKPHLIFDDLDKNSQEQYALLAKKLNISEAVSMYNLQGEQIVLDRTKRFIIMVLLEMYNEQVFNNSDFSGKNFMLDLDGNYGRVYTTAYGLACRIYNTKNPGKKTHDIMNHLRQLAGIATYDGEDISKWRGMLVYEAPNRRTGEIETTIMYDNLISLGGTSNKNGVFGFIKLHEAFFANIKNLYIHTYPTSGKLTDYYKQRIPPQSAITLDQKLKQAGSFGTKTLKMYASLLYDTLAHERFIVRDYKACEKITLDAIEACKFSGILKSHKITVGSTGEKLYELEINSDFFPKKESIKIGTKNEQIGTKSEQNRGKIPQKFGASFSISIIS